MFVAMVLRTGGDFTLEHVCALIDGVRSRAPRGTPILLLTDDLGAGCATTADVVTPLKYGWPGYWSKLELFRPDLPDDLLYVDLDSIVTGDLSDMLATADLILLRDFYRPEGLGSGLMRLPPGSRERIWESWVTEPENWIRRQRGGDQGFLERFWLGEARRWQDVLPGQVLSYKVDVVRDGKGVVPPDARLICFHGRPRPWATNLWPKWG